MFVLDLREHNETRCTKYCYSHTPDSAGDCSRTDFVLDPLLEHVPIFLKYLPASNGGDIEGTGSALGDVR